MYIDIEETPNPLSLKFIPEGGVLVTETLDIDNITKAKVSPLAEDLFKIEGVTRVYLGNDFIAVTIINKDEWNYLKPQIIACITDYYINKLPIVNEEELKEIKFIDSNNESKENSEVIQQIKELIEDRIRPAVAMDGGDVVFKNFEKGKVYLQLVGACSGCPSSSITLKNGIESMLKHFIPEVEEVVEVG